MDIDKKEDERLTIFYSLKYRPETDCSYRMPDDVIRVPGALSFPNLTANLPLSTQHATSTNKSDFFPYQYPRFKSTTVPRLSKILDFFQPLILWPTPHSLPGMQLLQNKVTLSFTNLHDPRNTTVSSTFWSAC